MAVGAKDRLDKALVKSLSLNYLLRLNFSDEKI